MTKQTRQISLWIAGCCAFLLLGAILPFVAARVFGAHSYEPTDHTTKSLHYTFAAAITELCPSASIPVGAKMDTVTFTLGRPYKSEWVRTGEASHAYVYHYEMQDGPAMVFFKPNDTVDHMERGR